MKTANPLAEQEVEQLILTFWKMQEEKARVVELMEITAPDLEISMGDFAWRGYKGLEDHQMGSKAQFFDQKFEPRSISRRKHEASPYARFLTARDAGKSWRALRVLFVG